MFLSCSYVHLICHNVCQYNSADVADRKLNSQVIDDKVKIQKTRIQALSTVLANQFKLLAKVVPDAPAAELTAEQSNPGDEHGTDASNRERLIAKLESLTDGLNKATNSGAG